MYLSFCRGYSRDLHAKSKFKVSNFVAEMIIKSKFLQRLTKYDKVEGEGLYFFFLWIVSF